MDDTSQTGVEESAAMPFRAAWWLRWAHAQTVGGKLLRPRVDVRLRRERIDTPDGDFLDLDFTADAEDRTDRPLVVVLHGLEGSARRRYMLLTYRSLQQRGLDAVGLNFRGCSGEPNRTARFYHSGETDDLRHVLGILVRRWPGRTLGAVGYSLGGNVLLKFLAEEGAASPVRAAVAVSVPFDLAAGARAIRRGVMGRVYTAYFLHGLRRKIRDKAALLDDVIDVQAALRARSLWAFDDAATAPISGFADARDYYRRCSSGPRLPEIRTPTLILHAQDDPFQPADRLPQAAAHENPAITARFTRRGGHVGFVAGAPWAPRFWVEEEIARFLGGELHDSGS
jgi:predicted alpha/beta-fold hydrolase